MGRNRRAEPYRATSTLARSRHDRYTAGGLGYPPPDPQPRAVALIVMPPRFSVLTAVCDPPIEVLERCLASVREQAFNDWEHIIVDDASTDPDVHLILHRAESDARVRVRRRADRGGIVAASNDALAAATGDIVALLDHDDELAPHALSTMAAVYDDEECDVTYSDHDLIRPDGRRSDPFFKPDFSPERLRHQNYITHFMTARRSIVEAVGGFRPGFDGAQDHDLILRLTEAARQVIHVPDVLYHWRQGLGSVALDPSAKQYAYDNGRRAVEEHCARVGITATVDVGDHLGTFVVRRPTSSQVTVLVAAPMETGVVWGRKRHHLARLAASLDQFTHQMGAELIVGVPNGAAAEALQLLDEAGCIGRVVEVGASDSLWSAALNEASTDIVVPVAEQMMLDHGSDIGAMAAHLAADDVSMVGCSQLNSDRTVRHGGFVTDHLGAHPILAGWAASHPGPGRLMAITREVGAIDVVGGALRSDRLQALLAQGDDAAITDEGVRLCAHDIAAGNRVIWTPQAVWYRFDPSHSGSPVVAMSDRYSNSKLCAGRGDWLERPGCAGAAPYRLADNGIRVWS